MSFVSRHRAGVRATTPVEQVRGALVRAAAAQWSSGRGEISHKSRLSTLRRKDPGIAPGPCLQPRWLKLAELRFCRYFMNLAARPLRQLLAVTVGGGMAALSVSYDSCKRPEEPRRYRRVPRCIARRRAWVVPSPRHVGAAPRRDKFGGLRDMSSTLAQ